MGRHIVEADARLEQPLATDEGGVREALASEEVRVVQRNTAAAEQIGAKSEVDMELAVDPPIVLDAGRVGLVFKRRRGIFLNASGGVRIAERLRRAGVEGRDQLK